MILFSTPTNILNLGYVSKFSQKGKSNNELMGIRESNQYSQVKTSYRIRSHKRNICLTIHQENQVL